MDGAPGAPPFASARRPISHSNLTPAASAPSPSDQVALPSLDRREPLTTSQLGFPTPADEDFALDGTEDVVFGSSASSYSHDPLLPAHPHPSPPAFPDAVPTVASPGGFFPHASTPLHDSQSDSHAYFFPSDLETGLLPSVDLATPPLVKPGHSLRLPSFNALGIAAPHPDRIVENQGHGFSNLGAGPPSKPEDPLHTLSPHQPHLHHFVNPITPPEDSPDNRINWGRFPRMVKTGAMASPVMSDPESNAPLEVGDSAHPPEHQALDQSAFVLLHNVPPWLQGALGIVVHNVHTVSGRQSNSVKVLSHALPCPSSTGHAFPMVINAIHESVPPMSTFWINVFHAVPGRFNLGDLPTSPPSTPGPAIGGEDYFTTKIFDSAVPVSDYQGDTTVLPRSSPNPAVQPLTVNVSIVERYIPPTSSNEFRDLFTITARSFLVDRLTELTPDNGTLLFIYPTRTGGRTFMREYLGPILDPLLRGMAVEHGLSADLGASIGPMPAVHDLFEFNDMRARLEDFMLDLSHRSDSLIRFPQLPRMQYELVYSSRQEVMLDRATWAQDWWIKQEKPRVRAAVTKYKVRKSTDEIMPIDLIQRILDGVVKQEYPGVNGTAGGPQRGVEVGVFVIRKTAAE